MGMTKLPGMCASWQSKYIRNGFDSQPFTGIVFNPFKGKFIIILSYTRKMPNK